MLTSHRKNWPPPPLCSYCFCMCFCHRASSLLLHLAFTYLSVFNMSLLKLDIFTECELNYFSYSINIYWASVLVVHFRGRNKSVMILKISAYLGFMCWIRLYFHRKTNQFMNFLICLLISDTKGIISFSITSQNLWQGQCSRPLLMLQFFLFCF